MGTSYHESVSSSLILAQNTVANTTKLLSTSNFIEFVTWARTNYKIQSVSDTLTLTDELVTNNIISGSCIDILVINQAISVIKPNYINASNTLNLQQTAVPNIKPGIASSTLELSQEISAAKPVIILASNTLYRPIDYYEGTIPSSTDEIIAYLDSVSLRQSVSVEVVYNKSVISYMQLVQAAYNCIYASASNHIHLSHLAESVEYGSIVNVLQLSQTVNVDIVEPVEAMLNLTQIIDPDFVYDRSLSNELELLSNVSHYFGGKL